MSLRADEDTSLYPMPTVPILDWAVLCRGAVGGEEVFVQQMCRLYAECLNGLLKLSRSLRHSGLEQLKWIEVNLRIENSCRNVKF